MMINYLKKYLFISLMLLPAISHAWVEEFNFDTGAEGIQSTEFTDASGDSVYEKNVTYAGAGSLKMSVEKGADGWGYWGGRKMLPVELGEGDEIWVRLRTFFPVGFDFNTNLSHLKFLRMTVKNGSGAHLGNHDLMINSDNSYLHYNELGNTAIRMEVFENEYATAQKMLVGETIIGETSGASATVTGLKPTGYNFSYHANSAKFSQFETITGQTSGESGTRMRYIHTDNNTKFGSAFPIRTDVWETIVLRMRFSVTNPLLQFYKHVGEAGFDINNKPIGGQLQLIYEDAIDKTLQSPTDKVWAFLIFTYWNGGAPKTQSMYIDDLQISTTPPVDLNPSKPPRDLKIN